MKKLELYILSLFYIISGAFALYLCLSCDPIFQSVLIPEDQTKLYFTHLLQILFNLQKCITTVINTNKVADRKALTAVYYKFRQIFNARRATLTRQI